MFNVCLMYVCMYVCICNIPPKDSHLSLSLWGQAEWSGRGSKSVSAASKSFRAGLESFGMYDMIRCDVM